MADTKISALTAAASLVGTEALPIVQSAATVKTTAADVAALATATTVGLANVTNDAQTKAAVVPNTAPSAGQLLVGNAGGTAYAPVAASGDATVASTGAVTIAAGAVTYAKMQDVSAASKLIGRGDSGAGDPQEITLGSGLTMTGTTLSAAGGGGSGDVVGPASATDNAIVRFDTTTGKLVQDSGVTISDTGRVAFVAGAVATPSVHFGDAAVGFYKNTTDQISVANGGAARVTWGLNLVRMASPVVLSWASGNASNGTSDTGFSRNAAGVVEVNDGTAGTRRDIWARTHVADQGTVGAPAYTFDIGGNRAYGFWYASAEIRASINGVHAISIVDGGIRLSSLIGESTPGNIYGFKYLLWTFASTTTLASASYNNGLLTNSTAAGAITLTLPTAVAGWNMRFADDNASNRLTVKPNTADTIIWTDGTVVTAATGSLVSTARYNSFDVFALDATVWLATNVRGTWTVTA